GEAALRDLIARALSTAHPRGGGDPVRAPSQPEPVLPAAKALGPRLRGDERNYCQPPPTNCTSSILSPSAKAVSPCSERGTISRLRSTATFFGSSDNS